MTIKINFDRAAAEELLDDKRAAGRARHALTATTDQHHTVSATLTRVTGEPVTVARKLAGPLLVLLLVAAVVGTGIVAAAIAMMKAWG